MATVCSSSISAYTAASTISPLLAALDSCSICDTTKIQVGISIITVTDRSSQCFLKSPSHGQHLSLMNLSPALTVSGARCTNDKSNKIKTAKTCSYLVLTFVWDFRTETDIRDLKLHGSRPTCSCKIAEKDLDPMNWYPASWFHQVRPQSDT